MKNKKEMDLPKQQISSNEAGKSKNAFKNFPIITGLVYIFGYIITNGYLSQYNITSTELFSIQYLKAGLSFLFMILPIYYFIYLKYENPTDNWNISKKEYVKLLLCILLYTVMIDFLIFMHEGQGISTKTLLLLATGFIVLSGLFSDATKNISDKKVKLSAFIVLVTMIFLFALIDYFSFFLLIVIYITCTGWILFLGDINDDCCNRTPFFYLSVCLILGAVFYGQAVYQSIPSYLGGVEKSNITFYLKENNYFLKEAQKFKVSGVYLFEDDKFFYIKTENGEVVALNKTMIDMLKYKNNIVSHGTLDRK